MREIKFRGKTTDGRWVYGDYFKTPLTDENSGASPDTGWYFLIGKRRHCIGQDGVSFVVSPDTVGQFTGLKDKNGKEIYEGDIIVSSFWGRSIVVWNNDVCAFQYAYDALCEGTAIGGRATNTLYEHDSKKWVIIGNIHDNPNLIS